MKRIIPIAIFLATSAFAADWYAKGEGYEKCMNTEDGLLICREDYVNNFCYGKERVWLNNIRRMVMYDRGEERQWYDQTLIAVRNLNYKCEYHGWSKLKLANGKWTWQCYINNQATKDEDCKGFGKKR